jgi:hypothetical protein
LPDRQQLSSYLHKYTHSISNSLSLGVDCSDCPNVVLALHVFRIPGPRGILLRALGRRSLATSTRAWYGIDSHGDSVVCPAVAVGKIKKRSDTRVVWAQAEDCQ